MTKTSLSISKWIAMISFYSYLAALFILGLFGLLFPADELQILYDLRFDTWDGEHLATFFHQYRFLKGFVLGFAVFSLVFRREIFQQRLYNAIFLITLFTAAGARVLSLLTDGQPTSVLIPLTISEFFFGFSILIYSRILMRVSTN